MKIEVRGDYAPMEEDFFQQNDFLCEMALQNQFLSEDTKVETQSNNTKLEPILNEYISLPYLCCSLTDCVQILRADSSLLAIVDDWLHVLYNRRPNKGCSATVANKLLHTKLEQNQPSKPESGSSWPPAEAMLYGVQTIFVNFCYSFN